jgi:hypothetical protein
MIRNAHKRAGLAATLVLLAMTSDVFAGSIAGGTVVYGPPAESIPALSGAMLVVLGVLFSVLAYRVLRNHPGGRPLASLVALAIAGLSAVSGIRVMQEAYAAPYPTYPMDNANGDSIHINDIGTDVSVLNGTGRTQQIKSVSPDPACHSVAPQNSPACAPGAIVPNGTGCWVQWNCAGT